MPHTRKDWEASEARFLAPYAQRSAAGRGRLHPEPPHELRADFARDRDRILHCRSFRRLEYKTQVFVNGTADHYRTRLTHTMEMAAVGRTLARALRANEDLTEAIALAHDIGHSPFGHVGEKALDELMKDGGGFDHNEQSCRAVERIEVISPAFPGLNLTWEVRAGLRKHRTASPGERLDGFPLGPQPFLEAQIADLCDDLTYHAHDLDDGLDAGLVAESDLEALELWRQARDRAAAQYPGAGDPALRAVTLRNLLDMQVEDAIRTSAGRLEEARPGDPAEVMAAERRMIANSPGMRARLEPLRTFLFERIYCHPSVSEANRESVARMRRLFLHYVERPGTMGRKARSRVPSEGLRRTACDYIAGMTDRYALEEVARFGLDGGGAEPCG